MREVNKRKKITEKLECVVLEGQSGCRHDCYRVKYTGYSSWWDRYSCTRTEFYDSLISANL